MNLIILPCHGVWKGGSTKGQRPEEWHLASFQVVGNDHLSFVDHIRVSVEQLRSNPNSHLIISGGQTKKESGPVLELLSYYYLLRELMSAEDELLLHRISLEEYARDLFENVLFLLCRFYELHNQYPDGLVIVGFEFKRDRFLKLHLEKALGWELNNVTYLGNEPDPAELSDIEREAYFEDLKASELKNGYLPFGSDWYGVGSLLKSKKTSRDPFKRYHGYAASNVKLRPFLEALRQEESTNEELKSMLRWK
ncbi:uncharacterized protein KQ657_002416 [Scheffersomyces spartinae]|uniref:Uncharacterized protein n=1 Tax=Scheffersomyces spartinae TaxID=45513 RepID=A0A9P7V6E6_9ASCO|nr:uncharacterized protein KQ657_002416 [Scheffersomyces spartinae]KAG7192059.1 hypothetical protein KQ657_002416 [Scheffersomyces spartinae]